MKYVLIILGSIITIILGIYYIRYRCFPWNFYLKARYGWANDKLRTFGEQYERHKNEHYVSYITGTTTNLSFKSFKIFYELNSTRWKIDEHNDFGDTFFQVVYNTQDNRREHIKVVFNRRDFQKYRKWLAKRRLSREIEALENRDCADLKQCQKIINDVKKDIEKTAQLAQEEVQKAEAIFYNAVNKSEE